MSTHRTDPSYYRVVATIPVFERLCYTVKDAVDWLPSPTAQTALRQTPTTALCSIVNQLDTSKRFILSEATRAKCTVDKAASIFFWRYLYGSCWNRCRKG